MFEGARFDLRRRESKASLDPRRAYGAFVEEEPDRVGGTVPVATILLTNRECPWKCVFCDLWTNTLDETVPAGAIAEQVRLALADLPPARWIKLYNAGSFFDPHAIPPRDVPSIVDLLAPFERVIVESHPALIHDGVDSRVLYLRERLRIPALTSAPSVDAIGPIGAPHRPANIPLEIHSPKSSSSARVQPAMGLDTVFPHTPLLSNPGTTLDSFARSASSSPTDSPLPRLEVAMGLETVHPLALERMNKGMTLEDFARAADVLRRADIDLRAFLLVQPPFTPLDEAVHWAVRSVDFAREHGARLVALIPTRGGNGAMEALRETGDFVPPRLSTLEEALDRALESVAPHGTPLVVADLWDLERFSDCTNCFSAREARLRRMNLSQRIEPRVSCSCSPLRAPGPIR